MLFKRLHKHLDQDIEDVYKRQGYTLNKTKYPVTISNNNQTITVTGTDKRQSGTLKLSKADSKTNKKPQGDATLQLSLIHI